MAVLPMLVVCDLDAGCVTRDGTTQPKGTAFDRVSTNPNGSDYNPGPGLKLVPDDGTVVLYVQNSGGAARPGKIYPSYPNATMARQEGHQPGDFYNDPYLGLVQLT